MSNVFSTKKLNQPLGVVMWQLGGNIKHRKRVGPNADSLGICALCSTRARWPAAKPSAFSADPRIATGDRDQAGPRGSLSQWLQPRPLT